jgi:hypothetical protein
LRLPCLLLTVSCWLVLSALVFSVLVSKAGADWSHQLLEPISYLYSSATDRGPTWIIEECAGDVERAVSVFERRVAALYTGALSGWPAA